MQIKSPNNKFFSLNDYVMKNDTYPVDSYASVRVTGDLVVGGNIETNGLKYDSEKPRLGLTPMLALTEVAKVLTYGAKKYAPDNWRKVANLQERYYDAALRHLTEYKYNKIDPESNLPHLAHCICSLMFMLEDQILAEKD